MSYLTSTVPEATNLASLILRIAIGLCFIVHGMGKLGIVGPGNLTGFTDWLSSLGVPSPRIAARLAMLSEILGGCLLVLGLFHRPACVILILTMLVAITIGHKGGGYLLTNTPPGNEYALNLSIVLFTLMLLGPGKWSIDAIWF